ncbi:MAG: hydrogenase, partial [Xanthomonadales bacterium]|nr:hydrogenase [Xanthomonadales bacterium]
MNILVRTGFLASTVAALAACASNPVPAEKKAMADDTFGAMRTTVHRDGDDLLSAGLGLAGLRGAQPTFADSQRPTASEARRRAIYTSWRGIADLGPLGSYGEIYGAVPVVTGREYSAFATLAGARAPHRVLTQVPDLFDRDRRCVVVTASSGSRGIYGAISLAGAWGLARGCAVAYTDKGAGSGYYDVASATGVRLDGTRGDAAEPLEFAPPAGAEVASSQAVLVKHAHSGDNPEADWGRHVLQAARFALAALDEAFPDQAPFTPDNTRIIAAGLSNGGGAVLRAAEADDGLLDGVVAIEPNIWAGQGGRALYDYTSEAALLLPCALVDARFDDVPFARTNGLVPPAWRARCATLHADGRLTGADEPARAKEALERLRGTGWTEPALASAAASIALDLARAVSVTYAAAYLRSGVGDMPCGYGFSAFDAGGRVHAPTATERAAWWSDASGIPPGAAIGLVDTRGTGPDPELPGLLCLNQLWTQSDAAGERLRGNVAKTRARLPREGLPVAIVHGVADGLVPIAFTSDPYVRWLEANGRQPMYWRVANAQHFDAFLAFPGFGDRYVPMMPYAYAALDHLWAHVSGGSPLPAGRDIATTPRGKGVLGASQLGAIP